MTTEIYQAAIDAICKCDAKVAAEIAHKGLKEGIAPFDLINNGFMPGISRVGDLFGQGKLFLPELTLAAKAMQTATDIINAAIPDGQTRSAGRFLIGTVEGDVHDIGKTIVVSLLKANGFTIKDLGRNVPARRFVEEAQAFNADIIGTSALLTTTMPVQKELEDELKKDGLKGRFKTMVGGAPVTQRWARRIGADAFAENANMGVQLAKQLLEIE